MDFKSELVGFAEGFSADLETFFEQVKKQGEADVKDFYDMIAYSLLGEGKRLRPHLLMKTYEIFGGKDMNEAKPFAYGIEMIHSYSLVHDDLPAMDDDDYRRGRLSSHMAYGEDMAILVGDALLNMAFEIMSEAAMKYKSFDMIKAMNVIAVSSGVRGMVGGQVLEIFEEGKLRGDSLKIEELKTAKLFTASILAGAVLAGVDEDRLMILNKYATHLGLLFQLIDDILDDEQDFDAMEVAKFHHKKAIAEIDRLQIDSDFYHKLANYMLKRDK